MPAPPDQGVQRRLFMRVLLPRPMGVLWHACPTVFPARVSFVCGGGRVTTGGRAVASRLPSGTPCQCSKVGMR